MNVIETIRSARVANVRRSLLAEENKKSTPKKKCGFRTDGPSQCALFGPNHPKINNATGDM